MESTDINHLYQRPIEIIPADPGCRDCGSVVEQVSRTHILIAREIIANGSAAQVAARIGALLGRVVDITDGGTREHELAKAISDNERREGELRQTLYLAMVNSAELA